MTTNTRKNETHILFHVVEGLLHMADTPVVQLCYEDDQDAALSITKDTPWDKIKAEAFACDMTTLRVGSKWVMFIWGNGEEGLTCISDYTVSLEDVLAPVFHWIECKEAEG